MKAIVIPRDNPPNYAFSSQVAEMLSAGDYDDGTIRARIEVTLSGDASQVSLDAVQKLTQKLTQVQDPVRLLWLALFGLDMKPSETDPREAILPLSELFRVARSKASDTATRNRRKLFDDWRAFETKLGELTDDVSWLNLRTSLLLIINEDQASMMHELEDVLPDLFDKVSDMAPSRGRGAPRGAAYSPIRRRTAVVMFLLADAGMKPMELHALVEHARRDWLPVSPIRPSEASAMLRNNKRKLRDQISSLIREGKRLMDGT